MASANSFPLFLSILLLFTSLTFSFERTNDHQKNFPTDPTLKSPKEQAAKFIRELNLFPKLEVNIVANHSAKTEPRLVEKRFEFPHHTGNSGATVKDLGHHAGYFKLPHAKDARMFYFFFESRRSRTDPVVIWLTGGPGCSSEIALFYENGPFHITKNMSLKWNDFGWDKVSNIIYVDQPIGTGFSYTSTMDDIRLNEEGVSNDLYDFLQAFFKKHPKYAENDFYITGESYAGHYIPAFASRVHKGNKDKEGIHINLKGFAIGNGLTNPEIQYKAYHGYALEMKLIKESDVEKLKPMLSDCVQAIKHCGPEGGTPCMKAFGVCNSYFSEFLELAGNVNYYDIRDQCGDDCSDFSNMETFLNQKSVRDALGVGNIEFVSCSMIVYEALMTDWMRNLEVGIPDLLESGIKLLVYAGEYDLICNWLGNSRWVHAMKWSGQKEFAKAPMLPFKVGHDTEAGLTKSYGPLTFLKVHDAGHMVPMDQPRASLEMLKRWINGTFPLPEMERKRKSK